MFQNRYHIENQIANYLSGECSPEDKSTIMEQIQNDDRFRSVYLDLKKIWEASSFQPTGEDYHVDAAWANVNSRIAASPLQVVHRFSMQSQQVKHVFSYAAGLAAVLLIGFILVKLVSTDTSLQTYASKLGVSTPVELSDGSHIVLNSNSEIKFPQKFGRNNREVYFWGEAFFEIAPDPTRPFVIESGDARIRILGTSFNLNARPESGTTEVVVNSGTVLFYHVDKNDNILSQITLLKGDKGTYNHASGKLTKTINDDPNFNSWKTGILYFSETSLDKVFDAVGKKYDVTFHMSDTELAKLPLTATFDNESLESVLEVLKLVHKLQFTHNGKDYLVKK